MSQQITPSLNVYGIIYRSYLTLQSSFSTCWGICIIVLAPVFIIPVTMPVFGPLVVVALWPILAMLTQACIAYFVFNNAAGKQASIGEAIARGLSRLLPLLLISIVVCLATGIGYLLLIIPGVVASCVFFVVTPVCVVERLGPGSAILRSIELTRGYGAEIFALTLVIHLPSVALIGFVIFISKGIYSTLPGTFVAITVTLSFVVAFHAVMTAMVYHALRSVKDGSTMESLARAFE